MAKNQDVAREAVKASYQMPELEVVDLPNLGTLTLSGKDVDDNKGEWDPLTEFLLS